MKAITFCTFPGAEVTFVLCPWSELAYTFNEGRERFRFYPDSKDDQIYYELDKKSYQDIKKSRQLSLDDK